MKTAAHPTPTNLLMQVGAGVVLLFILAGVFHSIPVDFSNHIKLENHWSSATPVLQLPFEEKDKEDNDDSSTTSLHLHTVLGCASGCVIIQMNRPGNTAHLISKLPLFLSLRSIRI